MFKFEMLNDELNPYIIAEIGANHNGDMELAKKLILSAVECGAHAVKFQSWSKRSLVSQEEYDRNQSYDDCPKKHFGSLEEMVEKYYLRTDQHFELKKYCDELNVEFCSTPFQPHEVDLLEELDVPFYKVASCDINNYSLLRYIASKKKPVILSTGMSELSEIDNAVKVIESEGNSQIAILHCISIYPPADEDIHLNNIKMLKKAFKYPVGFSDHSIGSAIPLASVALGATIIEKHFTLDKDMEGWDHMVSADPAELKEICAGAKSIAVALGNYHRIVSDAEKEKILKFRRSVVAKGNLKAGTVIDESMVDFKRPATGIAPSDLDIILGRTLTCDIKDDELFSLKHFE